MNGLDHSSLWLVAKEQAEQEAQLMFLPHMEKERRIAVHRLTSKYYRQYVTPPTLC